MTYVICSPCGPTVAERRARREERLVRGLEAALVGAPHHNAHVDMVIAQEEGPQLREQPDPCVDCAGGAA